MIKKLGFLLFILVFAPQIVLAAPKKNEIPTPVSVEIASFKPDKTDPKDWYVVQFHIDTDLIVQDGFIGNTSATVIPAKRTILKDKTITTEYRIRRIMSPFQIVYRVAGKGVSIDTPLLIPAKSN